MMNLQIRIDEDLKEQAQQVANDLGMDLTTAVRIFLKQMVRTHGLPFQPQLDPFFLPQNQAALKRSLHQLKQGKTVTKTLNELQELEH
ncbi:hypothetical protein COMNV_01250 [Commensalibacter sp. Nvir]|uniref:type II toxin-antitoxin system RelB/DinJ family antitoxin n=1 Tax=Commensalibacter sp. Nvir TaxID=3069817 RepID=UPI002D23C377|nr:hypothetical protein COMNV_01250 [Commensalibacter sp. Nvir]